MRKEILVTLLALAMPFVGVSDEAESLSEAVRNGKLELDLRYRVETVDQDGFEEDALASTLRTALGWTTAKLNGFSAGVQFESVATIGAEDSYNAPGVGGHGNGVTDRPVIADVEITQVNQAWVGWANDKISLKAGRQVIKFDDQRFVGPVGWRQNWQSFDALSLNAELGGGFKLAYAATARVHRIFGDSLPLDAHLADLSKDIGVAGKLHIGLYHLDYARAANAGASTTTFDIGLVGKREVGAITWNWRLGLSQQQDAGDNPADVDAGHHRIMVGGSSRGFSAGLGWEVLEGSEADGRFLTPLATLHAFNGWADLFLNTPTNGLDDKWLVVGYKSGIVTTKLIFHQFEADTGGADYGDELDGLVVVKPAVGPVWTLKYASYSSDGFSVDRDKLMLMAQWKLK